MNVPETPGTGVLSVTTAELLVEQASTARAIGDARRALTMRDVVIATVGPDPSAITPITAVSAHGLPVVEILAALAAQDPSGVLIIETSQTSFAFEVTSGRLTGARGPGAMDQLHAFVAETHRRYPERFTAAGKSAPIWAEVGRAFVEERALEQLALCRDPGTRMILIRGDVQWAGTRLAPGSGPSLHHVLLEHARRWDEQPKLLAALGSLRQIAVPLGQPGPRPTPHEPDAARALVEEDWDFVDDPDPTAMLEWDDAQRVWSLCDGQSSLAEIIDDAMLGRFRGLVALESLARGGHIAIVETSTHPSEASGSLADVIPMHSAEEAPQAAEISATAYSMVMKAPAPRRRKEPRAAASDSAGPRIALRRTTVTVPRADASASMSPADLSGAHAMLEQSLAEQSLAEQSLAEQSLAELAEQSPAQQSLAEQNLAAPAQALESPLADEPRGTAGPGQAPSELDSANRSIHRVPGIPETQVYNEPSWAVHLDGPVPVEPARALPNGFLGPRAVVVALTATGVLAIAATIAALVL